MKHYDITGMSCAACQARIEKAVSRVQGVKSVAVSLLTNSMGVEGNASDAEIIDAVTKAGYGASVKGKQSGKNAHFDNALEDKESPVLKKRLFISLGFLLVLVYFSMGHHMWGWPIPAWFENNPVAIALLQLLLATTVMIINQKFFISGFRGVFHGSPNMDTLVALGSSASFAWSTYALFMMTADSAKDAGKWLNEMYFESAAMILVLITVGKLLEAVSKGETTNALKSLISLAPKNASVIRNGEEITLPASEVRVGDVFTVRPGESIPVDGVIISGTTAINEAALTGESIPVDKNEGDNVSAATINQSGFIKCRATRVGEDTTLSQVIKLVSDAAATKAPVAKAADKVAGIFVPAVCLIAFVTLIVWLFTGATFDYSLSRAISVLVISCPCALGLATPVAIMVGNGVGAKRGILFKTAEALEQTGKTRIVVFDKTGTVTEGEPQVTGLYPADGVTEEELIFEALSLENESEHPLARAIVDEGLKNGMEPHAVSDFQALPGHGLTAVSDGETLYGGSFRFISSKVRIPNNMKEFVKILSEKGNTPLLFAKSGKLLGIITVADTIKDDARETVELLEEAGVRVVMLTGDNDRTAASVCEQAGIKHFVADVLPDGKAAVIQKLKTLGKVAMVGDGINDAPALVSADIGIAIGAGTDVAIDAADVVLMNSSLMDVPVAIRLSRATLRDIHQNLFWAFFYNALCIPLAAGCYISLFGWALSPMVGAAAMSLSSFCVAMNALRLNLVDISLKKRYKKAKDEVDETLLKTLIDEINGDVSRKIIKKEESEMTKTIKIEGMMCPHCEANAKKALEAIDGVKEAVVSHKAGTAVVTLAEEVSDDTLKAVIDEAGYKVTGIE